MLKLSGRRVAALADAPPFLRVRHHRRAKPRLSETEGEISQMVESQQLAVDAAR
jgi:hypothetical protein